jgi:hypothetical protein
MSQTITMTELLRNPKRVRELVKKGIKIYVLYEGEIAMVINLPEEMIDSKKMKMPSVRSGLKKDYTITREDIYGENSWLDKE